MFGSVITGFSPIVQKKCTLPSRMAFGTSVLWIPILPFRKPGSRCQTCSNHSRCFGSVTEPKFGKIFGNTPISQQPWTFSCPRIGRSPLPSSQIFPVKRNKFEISQTAPTPWLKCVTPIPCVMTAGRIVAYMRAAVLTSSGFRFV